MSRAGTLVRSDFLMMGTRGSGTKSGMARVARISSAWVQDFPRYPEAWLAAWACGSDGTSLKQRCGPQMGSATCPFLWSQTEACLLEGTWDSLP